MQNQEDPNILAGDLPHTISIKDIHNYVEGTSQLCCCPAGKGIKFSKD